MIGEDFFMGGAEAPVTVAFRLPWHFCSPLRYRKSKVPQELRILLAVSSHTERRAEWACRNRIATNTGKDGAGRGKKKKIPNKKNNCPHRSKKWPEISTNAQPKTSPWVEGRATFALKGHKIPNDDFALTGRSLHRLLPMTVPCADCSMPLYKIFSDNSANK